MGRSAGTFAVVCGLALSAAALSASEVETVWRIGAFDRSSREFAAGEQKPGSVFIVGESDPARDWHANQTVSGLGSGARAVQFDLPESASGGYRLRIALLVENANVPVIDLGINGHRGRFFLHPVPDYAMGDPVGGNRQGYSHADVAVDIPPGYLQAGVNTIKFLVADTSKRTVPDAGVNYDAIELDRVAAAAVPPPTTAEIEPTVFFQRAGKGLAELVDVYVGYGSHWHQGAVDLEVAGGHDRQDLGESRDFGQQCVEFAVPEFSGPVPATVAVTLDGVTTRTDQVIAPERKWTVYVVPHIHIDMGYTDYPAKVGALQARTLDEAMKMIDEHPDFRFSTDGEWNLEQFMETRSAADRARLIEAMRRRQIFVPADYTNLLTGFPTAETLIRSLYPAANFSRLHGTPFEYATLTDVPSPTWSYASVLAAAGIGDFLAGGNNDRGPIVVRGHLDAISPFWWEGPDGGRVLLWYALAYRQVQMLFGLPPLVEAGRETLPLFLARFPRPEHRSDAVILYGTQGENRDLYPQQASLVDRWNAIYAYPHLQNSGVKDAMEAIAAASAGDVPVLKGDGGPYWEDGIGANPYYAAMERETERRALSAEKLSTVGTLVNPLLAADKPEFDRMWKNILMFDEHTGTTSHISPDHNTQKALAQLASKEQFAINAQAQVNARIEVSGSGLADAIPAGPGSFIVFNTLNWNRDGVVFFDLVHGDEIVEASSGRTVPFEVVNSGATVPANAAFAGDSFQRVRFVARDVPAMGYKVYRLRRSPERAAEERQHEATMTLEDAQAQGPVSTRPTTAPGEGSGALAPASVEGVGTRAGDVLESPFYRVELDPATGAVRSIFDKQLGRELVDVGNTYRFGEYLYVTGGDGAPGTNGLLQYAQPPPALTIHAAGGGRLVSIRGTPEGEVARLESSALHTRLIETEIRLFDRAKRIEFTETVNKDEVYRREGVYFAFPFAMSHPRFQYEIQNGVIDPDRDMLPGAGKEWFTVQSWVSVEQDGLAGAVLPLDASLVTLGDINRGTWPGTFGARPGTIFSYVLNNYHQPRALVDWPQGPEDRFRYRYVVTSGPSTDPVALSRLGWDVMTPMEQDEIQPQDKSFGRTSSLDAAEGSFLEAGDPALLLQTWKPAEDGDGTILRFLDLGGAPRTVEVRVPLIDLTAVEQTDAVERNVRSLALVDPHRFRLEVHPHEILTVRLIGAAVGALKP